ncbi:Gfo/Idh/MocA family protein [Paenibacillus daejeonensis]|uniref:Gfo/Idh/MocA family protein n=1 Tax=Paenibacillus daejeonensis TaxID=135193 RepID=UPI00035D6AAD|nr:Gfo/Idh/MocA family oxidoreductase [Paenibacillus daejeonensis]
MTVKFAVAGTGWVAGEYLKAIHGHAGAQVHTVVTSDRGRGEAKLTELGLEGVAVSTDFEAVVQNPEIDAIVLCSMPGVRPQQAILAAQHGKALILEKPMALDLASMDRMGEALAKYPVKTAVSFVLRWNPTFDMIKALIDDNALGRVFMAQVDYWHHIGPHYDQYRWNITREVGVSSILSAGCHAVDAVRYFAGDITEVTAYSCGTWSDSEYEYDPNAIAIFKLANGGIGKVSSSLECKTPYKFNIHLLGEKGSIMDNQLFSTTKLPGQTDYATIPTILPNSGDVSHHPFVMEIHEFVDALQHDKAIRCDFQEAYRSMRACFAIDESIATGKTIKLG